MIATNPALTKETPKMIDLYTWPTPNGHKIHIMLEETGLPYNVIPIDINKGDQFDPEYLKLSPNNKMPAMVDTDGPGGEPYGLFESGAILMYLSEKTGKFMPAETAARYRVIQWLMFQMGGIGPLFGQAHHFRQYAPEGPAAQAFAARTCHAESPVEMIGVWDTVKALGWRLPIPPIMGPPQS